MGRKKKIVFVYRWNNYLHRKSQRIDQKLLELISSYSKAVGYNVNIQKSITFLYTSNEYLEFEIENTTPFTLAPKNKILRYTFNKIFPRSIWGKQQDSDERKKEHLSKLQDSSCACIERPNIVKMLIIPNVIYRFDAIWIKIPVSYFVDINKLSLKFIQWGKRPRIVNTILENKVKGLTLPDKTYCKATVVKTVWYWQKKKKKTNRLMEQNRAHK